MKKLLRTSAFLLMAGSLFTGCTRSTRTTSTHYLTATSSSIGAFSSSGSSVVNDGAAGSKMWIRGTDASGAYMLVVVNPYAGVTGTFTFVTFPSDMGCEYHSGTTTKVSVHGSITLTSVAPDVIGTFTFTAIDSSVFTGSFNAPMPSM